MNWRSIRTSFDGTCFLVNGTPLWQGRFLEVMSFHRPGVAPVRDESGWYHINTAGHPLYGTRYRRAFGFYCDRAAVLDGSGWFHVDLAGNACYAHRYPWCGNFQEGSCVVRTSDGYHHIDGQGRPLHVERYDYAGDARDGIICWT